LDATCRQSKKPFVSGWYTNHPYYGDLLALDDVEPLKEGFRDYKFLSDDLELIAKIRTFHQTNDSHDYADDSIFVGAGSSPLMFSALVALKSLGFREILYAPPIYYTLYYFSDLLGIKLVSIGESPTGNSGQFSCQLPNNRSALIITDPSWISGKKITQASLESLADWQNRTKSFVFVDGTFQYLSWDRMRGEKSSELVENQTIRLVCPTKSLCVHGARFSYLLIPRKLREEIRYPYSNTSGAASVSDRIMAHRLMDQLLSSDNNRALANYVAKRYGAYLSKGILKSPVDSPDATYYVFGETSYDLDRVISMNSDFFEVPYPSNYIRLNLLAPSISLESA
jgi:aspartate/methionine/tyrosine aminotransferase